MKISTLLFLLICPCLIACEKVIEVKLNDSEAMYIIEGEITDAAAGPVGILETAVGVIRHVHAQVFLAIKLLELDDPE